MSVFVKNSPIPLVVVFIKINTLGKTNSLIMESLNALFEYTTEGIIIANQSGTIIRANPSSEKLFGYETGELLNQKIEF
jgi:PAS domain-containing protein